MQDIEESPESFGGKIDFSNFEGEHGVDRIVFLFERHILNLNLISTETKRKRLSLIREKKI